MADILENPVDLIDDAYEQEIQVEQEMIEVVAYRSYNRLDDKPQINGVELVGNKTSSDLGITAQIESAVNSEAQARAQADNTLQGKIDTEKLARQNADTALGGRIDTEIHDRQVADIALQGQIDAITSKSDVVDVVATYADLQAYDTQHLGDNDVVKVLDDETHEDALTYYRWSTTTQTWTYIGQEAPYYSKGQMDVMLQGKQDKLTAGANIQIQNGTISATDTTYTAGNGLNLNGTEFSADTDVLATKEDLEGYYTKPETDNLLAPKLEAEVVTELPTTGAEGKLYLTPKAHTTSTATGNPIEATITAQAGQLESFQLDGDTFQQSYTGKNLCDGTIYKYWYVINAQGEEIPSGDAVITNAVQVEPDTTYTASVAFGDSSVDKYLRVAIYTSDMTFISRPSSLDGGEPVTFTTPSNARYIRLSYYVPANNAQLELGSTATSFEPFVGGQPSPSPSYPQPFQTVTGLQTISINGTDYPLDLGSIELCKLDTYQDYIWKDGEDWKVHKSVGKAELWNGTNWRRLNTVTTGEYRFSVKVSNTDTPTSASSDTLVHLNSNYWPACSRIQTFQQTQGIAATGASDFSVESFIAFVDSLKTSGVDGWKAWLTANKPVVYYQSTTPTDTTITDTTLIAQLDAIRTASLQNGTNTITNTATGTNLAGDMEIGYYGFNPTNRYDKFIWLDLNNNYEQIGS